MPLEAVFERALSLTALTLVHGTILALLTWLLSSTLLRAARPALHAVLWTVVLVKFLTPPILPGELALSSWLARLPPAQTHVMPEEGAGAEGVAEIFAPPMAAPERPSAPVNWRLGVVMLYLVLVAGLALRSALRARDLWRSVRLLPRAGEALRAEARGLARSLGIRRQLDVRLAEDNLSPCVIGWWNATLVLPLRMMNKLDPASRRALILHELAHVRRGDLVVRGLQNVARVLLFFWPPVWWVCRRVERFAEMACDQWAISASGVDPAHYARSLLEVVKSIASPPPGRYHLALARKGSLMEERFEMILNRRNLSPQLPRLMIPVVALWTVFAVTGGATGSLEEGQKPEKQEKEKRVQKIFIRSQAGEPLPAEVLEKFPEADLNRDGILTLRELREHLGEASPGSDEVIVERGQRMQRLLEELEREGHHLHGEHSEFEVLVEAPEGLGEEQFDLVVGSLQEIRERYPDSDLDGNGELTTEELTEWGQTRAREQGRFAVRIESETDGQVEAEAYVWGVQGDVNWTSNEGEEKIVIKGKTRIEAEAGEKGEVRKIVVKIREGDWNDEEALARGAELSEGRLQRLLQKYPEADLDGDGTLSREEVQELAARIQKSKQK